LQGNKKQKMNYKLKAVFRQLLSGAIMLALISSCATNKTKQTAQHATTATQPKLVVGIVVDQMRYEYLYRYQSKFGEGGFKRLLNQGFNCQNTQFDYTPTYTGPGHASVYTGTTPAIHAIAANNWYKRELGRMIYCTEDTTVSTVGSASDAGHMSPRNMQTTTITDQLRLATSMRSKVIGISMKDRGSILPAGHLANAAYWYESKSGNWISSTYYMQELPQWVKDFNSSKEPEKYLSQPWNPLLPLDQYTASSEDNQPFESPFKGEEQPVFPHDLPALRGKDYSILTGTPFGNTFTRDFAKAAIKAENLGRSGVTDFLALSFSSPDYIGHQFGPNSIELEDTYIRLDKDLEDFLNFLDKEIGKDQYLLFLTADHGVAMVPDYAHALKLPAGAFQIGTWLDSLNQYLSTLYGNGKWIENYSNDQIYLNHKLIRDKKLNLQEIQQKTADFMLANDLVVRTLTASTLQGGALPLEILEKIQRGYSPQENGDVYLLLKPGWFKGDFPGTTHGSPYRYDTHAPLLFFGWNIQPGKTAKPVNITDIAPTIANMLNISEPNGTIGHPILPVVESE
jgi:predicted AlkP superfamily pyrophosphatase or phosphodiesterase